MRVRSCRVLDWKWRGIAALLLQGRVQEVKPRDEAIWHQSLAFLPPLWKALPYR